MDGYVFGCAPLYPSIKLLKVFLKLDATLLIFIKIVSIFTLSNISTVFHTHALLRRTYMHTKLKLSNIIVT